MCYSPKGPSPKPEGTKHVLVQRITSQRVKVQNFKGQSGQSPNSLSPKTDSPKQDLVQKGGSKKAMGLSPGRTKSDLANVTTGLLSCIGYFEENIDLFHIHLAVYDYIISDCQP